MDGIAPTPFHVALYMLAAVWGLVAAAALRAGRSGASLLAALGYTPALSYYYTSVYQAVYSALLLLFHSTLLLLAVGHTVEMLALVYMESGAATPEVVAAYATARSLVYIVAPLAASSAALILAARCYAALRYRLRPPLCPLLLEAGVVAAYVAAVYSTLAVHLVVAALLTAVAAPAMMHVSRASRLASKALLRRVRGLPGAR